jgi:PAS domain S-box-containing protein
MLSFIADVTERKQTADALRESEKRFRQITESAEEWIWEVNHDGLYTYTSHVAEKILGYKLEEIVGEKHFYDFFPPDKREQLKKEIFNAFAAKRAFRKFVNQNVHKNGSMVILEKSGVPILDSSGGLLGYRGVDTDITEQRKLEAQYLHAQKMEAVGQLASGVAHDFNNILSAIIGYGHMALMKMAQDDPQRLNIQNMLEAADKAVHLTKDLLLFSRKHPSDRKPVDLNEVIRKTEKFLKRVIGEDIECKTILHDRPITTLADSNQLEQVLMNLATNARDAMPDGGVFTITAEQVYLNKDFIAAHDLYCNTGPFALITISDTGRGIDEETRKRIFEPFFTTKEVGKGTGLGLAVVYGIIKQHEGCINVYSEPGSVGTTFRIYLPLIASEAKEVAKAHKEEAPAHGTETVLVAEDDEALRKLSSTVLKQFGYIIIEAVDGEDAMRKFMENKDKVHLLLFDLIMPKMNGKEAYDEIRKLKPDIKVIFASGYAPDIVRQKVSLEKNAHLIYKPVSPFELLRKVRSVLDGTTQ